MADVDPLDPDVLVLAAGAVVGVDDDPPPHASNKPTTGIAMDARINLRRDSEKDISHLRGYRTRPQGPVVTRLSNQGIAQRGRMAEMRIYTTLHHSVATNVNAEIQGLL